MLNENNKKIKKSEISNKKQKPTPLNTLNHNTSDLNNESVLLESDPIEVISLQNSIKNNNFYDIFEFCKLTETNKILLISKLKPYKIIDLIGMLRNMIKREAELNIFLTLKLLIENTKHLQFYNKFIEELKLLRPILKKCTVPYNKIKMLQGKLKYLEMNYNK